MSKLANIHFTYEMADRVSDKEYAVKVMAAHPGYSDSNLIEKGPSMKGRNFLARAGRVVNKIFAQSTEMGALPTLYAATAPEAIHRAYYGPRGGMRGYPERVYPNAKKVNKEVQVRLWELSEELTKVSFLNGN
jgi:NAD(P)-dependent dehydrogenase (short-subunit alcohol dehydrogenase family)